jgi:hypothetical protein
VSLDGGRTWWAHLEFTRITIDRIILSNQIEEFLHVVVFSGSIGEFASGRLPVVVPGATWSVDFAERPNEGVR